jgi:methyltransferase
LSVKKGQLVANEIIGRVGDSEYWGYHVLIVRTLSEITSRLSRVNFLITTRKGKPIPLIISSLTKSFKRASEVVLIFGSPRNDVLEIINKIDRDLVSSSLAINMFPLQGTNTVRLEEALLGSLAIINSIRA